MREFERSRVFAVRRGEVPFNEVLTEIGQLERDLADLLDASPLPATPDRSAVDDFLVTAHLSCWNDTA